MRATLPTAVEIDHAQATLPMYKTEEGFTLIEVLIVVGIMGIAAVMAAPNYIQWNARYQLRQAVTELQSNLNLARMAAMNQNTTVIVTPTIAGGRLSATFTTPAGATVMPAYVETVREVTGLSGGPVQFSSLGLRIGGGPGVQTLTLTNRNGVIYSIGVTPGGKVRWCESSACT
jgi:type IV fimbrial biogenesis protein FimT